MINNTNNTTNNEEAIADSIYYALDYIYTGNTQSRTQAQRILVDTAKDLAEYERLVAGAIDDIMYDPLDITIADLDALYHTDYMRLLARKAGRIYIDIRHISTNNHSITAAGVTQWGNGSMMPSTYHTSDTALITAINNSNIDPAGKAVIIDLMLRGVAYIHRLINRELAAKGIEVA